MPTARSAFTLPEVLVTILILSIIIPAVMSGISLSLAAADDARRKVEAVALAENKLAELTAGSITQSSAGAMSGDFGQDYPAYRWQAQANQRDVSLLELEVQVLWTSRSRDRSIALSTFVFQPGTTTTGGTGGSNQPTNPN